MAQTMDFLGVWGECLNGVGWDREREGGRESEREECGRQSKWILPRRTLRTMEEERLFRSAVRAS